MHVFRGYSAGAVDYVFKPIQPLDPEIEGRRLRRSLPQDRGDQAARLRPRRTCCWRTCASRREARGRACAAPGRGASSRRSTRIADRPVHGPLDGTGRTAALHERQRRADHAASRRIGLRRAQPLGSRALMRTTGPRARRAPSRPSQSGAATLEYRWRTATAAERHILDQAVLIRDEAGEPRKSSACGSMLPSARNSNSACMHASKLEAVGRLTGGIAHDFNNMLSIVIGNLDLLQRIARAETRRRSDVWRARSRVRNAAPNSPVACWPSPAGLRCRPWTFGLQRFHAGADQLLHRTLGERIRFGWRWPSHCL